MNAFDRRITPARPDLAADHLRGLVEAERFVSGEPRIVRAATAPLRREPRLDCPLDTEALRGEAVTVFEEDGEGWAWVQLARDRYVGYMPAASLGPVEAPTHRVAAFRTLVFPAPDLKTPVLESLSLGSLLAVGEERRGFGSVTGGWVWLGHLAPLEGWDTDFVQVAERFLGVPYLWGGRSSLGLDCSGLVQTALAACGGKAPRDSDMQAKELGDPLPGGAERRRGDLVFWPGHVGIMRDPETLLHANGHAMAVTSEKLATVTSRIESGGGSPISVIRRLG